MGLRLIFVSICLLAGVHYGYGGMCGQSKPDHYKTCISVRLPWKTEPIYFCTEKENLRYEKRCPDSQRCVQKQWSNTTLLIATPWDCCPIASTPSKCEHTVCPSKPFNRTCVTLTKKHSDGCCPSYFCEEDAEVEQTCNFKTLEPSCHTPPTDKANCVGFVDHYGCCTKYQCEGEGKPGTCPTYPAYPLYDIHVAEHGSNMSAYRTANRAKSGRGYSSSAAKSEMSMIRKKYPAYSQLEVQSCIGDWNCPDDMKCCSSSYGGGAAYAYPRIRYASTLTTIESDSTGDSNSVFYDSKATYGYCKYPVKAVRPSHKKTTASDVPAVVDDAEDHAEN